MIKLDREKIGELLQFTIHNLLDPKDQYCGSDNDHMWCDDYEQIERMKFLFEGEEKYYMYESPFRAKDNPLFSKDRVRGYCENLLQLHTESLAEVDESIKTLFIVEVKRGLDILISSMNRKWEKIFISSFNCRYNDLILQHFSDLPIAVINDGCYSLKDTGSMLQIHNSIEYDKGGKNTWNILAQGI